MTVNSTNMLDELRAFYHDIVGTKPTTRSDSPINQASARRFQADKPFPADRSDAPVNQLQKIRIDETNEFLNKIGKVTEKLKASSIRPNAAVLANRAADNIETIAVATDDGLMYVAVRF